MSTDTSVVASSEVSAASTLLPSEMVQRVAPDGSTAGGPIDPDLARRLLERMITGRRFDEQATTATRQGRLAVYPSSRGQEACQVGAVAALHAADWLFPTYRDSVALLTRGIDPIEVLTLLRGDWHCGYDPMLHRVAPQCTPLATNAPHAVGLGYALARRGEQAASLVLLGDGATSEGDTHEALNFAAVFGTPTVFVVQNNGFAISVPVTKQTKAPTLAHKAIGYGMPGVLVDGNDVIAVYEQASDALERARAGGGPTLVEAVTYRIEAHTNADDATRYRDADEVKLWLSRDPISRLVASLRANDDLTDTDLEAWQYVAEQVASIVRERLADTTTPDPLQMFDHVYATPTPALLHQRQQLSDELSTDAERA